MAAVLARVRTQAAKDDGSLGYRFKKQITSMGSKPAKKLRKFLAKYNCAKAGGVAAQPGRTATPAVGKHQGDDTARELPVGGAAVVEDITLTMESLPASHNDGRSLSRSSSADDALLYSSEDTTGAANAGIEDEEKAALVASPTAANAAAGTELADVTSQQCKDLSDIDDAVADDTVVFKPTGDAKTASSEIEPTPRLIVGPRRRKGTPPQLPEADADSSPHPAAVFSPIDEETMPEPTIIDGAEVLTLSYGDIDASKTCNEEIDCAGSAAGGLPPRPPAVFTMIPLTPESTMPAAGAGGDQRPATPTSPYRLPMFAAPIQTRIPRSSSRPGTPTASASMLSSPCATAGSFTPPGSALSRRLSGIPGAPRDYILRPSSPGHPDLYSAMSDAAYQFAASSIAATPTATTTPGSPAFGSGSVTSAAATAGGGHSTSPGSPSATTCYATSSLAMSRCSTPCSLASSSMLVRGASGRFVLAFTASLIPACPPAFSSQPASPGNLRPGTSRIPTCPAGGSTGGQLSRSVSNASSAACMRQLSRSVSNASSVAYMRPLSRSASNASSVVYTQQLQQQQQLGRTSNAGQLSRSTSNASSVAYTQQLQQQLACSGSTGATYLPRPSSARSISSSSSSRLPRSASDAGSHYHCQLPRTPGSPAANAAPEPVVAVQKCTEEEEKKMEEEEEEEEDQLEKTAAGTPPVSHVLVRAGVTCSA